MAQSWNTSSQVWEPRMPSLSSFCAVLKPLKVFSTMKALMHLEPASFPAVRMYTSSTSASGPLVIHILLPLATHMSPFFSALQVIEPTTSEPAPGSLIASAPMYSPEHIFGMYLRRCASLPLWKMFCTARLECAPYDSPTEPDAREISSIATMCARKPRPLPPYSSGMVTPSSPISPNFFHRSAGNRLSRSTLSARGAISFSANPCTDSRSRSMSSPSGNGRISDSLLSRRTILAYAWRPCRQSPGQEKGPPMPWAALDAPTRRLLPAHAALEAGTAVAHVRQLDLADGADALLGQAVGGQVGRHVLGLADLEDAAQVVIDRAHHAHRALAVVAIDLQRHVHHAA